MRYTIEYMRKLLWGKGLGRRAGAARRNSLRGKDLEQLFFFCRDIPF